MTSRNILNFNEKSAGLEITQTPAEEVLTEEITNQPVPVVHEASHAFLKL